jgi:2-iminoacetate synthase ThiH
VGVNLKGTNGNFFYVESGSRLNLKTIATALFGKKENPVDIPEFLVRALEIHDGMIISFSLTEQSFIYKT